MHNNSTTRSRNRRVAPAEDGGRTEMRHSYAGQVYEGARDAVSEYPLSSVLITMGLGFGAGMLLAAAIARPPQRKRYLTNAGSRMEDLGQRVLDAVSGYLPRPSRW
jgi:hypothetical protein